MVREIPLTQGMVKIIKDEDDPRNVGFVGTLIQMDLDDSQPYEVRGLPYGNSGGWWVNDVELFEKKEEAVNHQFKAGDTVEVIGDLFGRGLRIGSRMVVTSTHDYDDGSQTLYFDGGRSFGYVDSSFKKVEAESPSEPPEKDTLSVAPSNPSVPLDLLLKAMNDSPGSNIKWVIELLRENGVNV